MAGERPIFHYDFSSPYSYLAAARVDSVLPVEPVWRPVVFGAIVPAVKKIPWSMTEGERERGIAECERCAAERGLPPLRCQEIKDRLRTYTDDALAAGVTGVPTVSVDGELFWGDDRLEDAAAALAG